MTRQGSRIGEDAVRTKTGKGWDEWFALLDAWDAVDKGHAPTAKHLAEAHGLSGWWAQMVTVEYERARGLRQVGQKGEQFVATVQRTIRTSPEIAFKAVTEPSQLSQWFTKDAQAELWVGGRYENKDGDRGEFLRFDPPERLRGRTQSMRPAPSWRFGSVPRGRRNR
jgi:hypothetical protein